MTPSYREVLGKVEGLQRGFTSGTCAQAASQAAAEMLVSQETRREVTITLKNGMVLVLPVVNQTLDEESASCGIIKDSGDDTDITNGKEFRAEVSWSGQEGIRILGGPGIGRVTQEGLSVAVGEPAVNPHPRRMILLALEPLLPRVPSSPSRRGFRVELSIPEGEALARETWNPRIGIVGGLGIIGTSGIIEPKSSRSFQASIVLLLKMAARKDRSRIYLIPGYVGEAYLKNHHSPEEERVIKVGDHVGFSLESAAAKDFDEIFFAGHIGKMAKVASGLFDTHCRHGDARLETVAACAAAAGASQADVLALLEMTTAEAAVPFLRERGLEEAFGIMNRRLAERCILRMKRPAAFTSVILDLKGHPLSEASLSREEAAAILQKLERTKR